MISFLGKAKYPLTGTVLFCALIAAFYVWNRNPGEGDSYPKSFDGNSVNLKQTVIVPTLDTPFPEGKSAIWCSSFQIAWNKLKANITGPIRIKDAEETSDRLNRAEESEDDLEVEMFYSEAGWVKQGIVEKIQNDMAKRFPEVPKPEFEDADPDSAIAYGYLKAEINFKNPYLPNDQPFYFQGKEKTQTEVKSFGVEKSLKSDEKIREQIEVLFCEFSQETEELKSFAVDLCKNSSPNQIVLAYLQRSETLGGTLADLEKKIARKPSAEYRRGFGHNEKLLVPNMNWRIRHRFKELEHSSDQAFWISQALQVIEFRLEKTGVKLSSEARILDKAKQPREFHFNRPFLIYLKKRDAKHPFFVMWVDNAELLIKT